MLCVFYFSFISASSIKGIKESPKVKRLININAKEKEEKKKINVILITHYDYL